MKWMCTYLGSFFVDHKEKIPYNVLCSLFDFCKKKSVAAHKCNGQSLINDEKPLILVCFSVAAAPSDCIHSIKS